MTFEIYKLEWILSRHTFGNTTQQSVKSLVFHGDTAHERSVLILRQAWLYAF